MKYTWLGWWLLLIAVSNSASRAAMVVQSYAPENHDRFYAPSEPSDPEKAFIGEAYDWSGVGVVADGRRWGTMISSQYFLSATHSHPSVNASLRFFHTNDATGPFEDHVVESGVQIDGTDLWLGKLATAISSDVAIYPVLDLPTNGDYNDRDIWTFGRSNTTPTDTSVRLGRNTIDPNSYQVTELESPTGIVTGTVFLYDFDDPGGVGPDESYLQAHDSGAPSLTIYNGLPALLGTHWYIWEEEEAPEDVGSADSFIPEYIDSINGAMDTERLSLLSDHGFLIWSQEAEEDWSSTTAWTGGHEGEIPHLATQVVVESGRTNVASAKAKAAAVTLAAEGSLVLEPDGRLEISDQLSLINGAELSFWLSQEAIGTVDTGGDTLIGEGVSLTLGIDGASPFLAGTYTLINAQGSGGIDGQFTSVTDLGAYTAQGALSYEGGLLRLVIEMDLNLGDANLDGITDLGDFNVWNAHKFQSGTDWRTGDFNGDGITDLSDFNVWNSFKFTSADPPAAAPLGGIDGELLGDELIASGSSFGTLADNITDGNITRIVVPIPEPGVPILLAGFVLTALLWQRRSLSLP